MEVHNKFGDGLRSDRSSAWRTFLCRLVRQAFSPAPAEMRGGLRRRPVSETYKWLRRQVTVSQHSVRYKRTRRHGQPLRKLLMDRGPSSCKETELPVQPRDARCLSGSPICMMTGILLSQCASQHLKRTELQRHLVPANRHAGSKAHCRGGCPIPRGWHSPAAAE
jgi:hypothetical protein